MADIERSAPEEIEDAIRTQVRGIYSDYMKNSAAKPVIIDVNIYNSQFGIVNKNQNQSVEEFLKGENLKFIARPYNLIKSLREQVVASGDNYIITTSAKYPEEVKSLSILVYNFNEKLKEEFNESRGRADDLKAILNYTDNVELLKKMLRYFRRV